MGQSRHFGHGRTTSGLPPEADIVTASRHVSKMPGPDMGPAIHLFRRRGRAVSAKTETAGPRRSPMTELLRRVFAGAESP
jgi:hypothetical protein